MSTILNQYNNENWNYIKVLSNLEWLSTRKQIANALKDAGKWTLLLLVRIQTSVVSMDISKEIPLQN